MSRDSGGTYISPSGQFTPGTTILSNVVNSKFNDLGDEITNSLDRNGKGGMLTYLRGVDGTINLPAYSFTAETTIGLRRAGDGDVRMAKDGTDLQKWSTAEVRVYQAFLAEKGLTVTNSTSNGAGVTSTGNGTGAGGVFTGGGVNANGITITGGATAGKAIEVLAGSYGAYIRAGIGLDIVATAGSGAAITGAGGAAGVILTGGAGAVGAQIAAGTAATGADPTNALELTNGNLKLSGAAPNSSEALANTLTPANIPKVWGRVVTNGGPVLSDGFGIQSVAYTASKDLLVTFATAFANAVYVPIVTTSYPGHAVIFAISTTAVEIRIYAADGSTVTNLEDAPAISIYFMIIGRQA
jgi:hypothetical protein